MPPRRSAGFSGGVVMAWRVATGGGARSAGVPLCDRWTICSPRPPAAGPGVPRPCPTACGPTAWTGSSARRTWSGPARCCGGRSRRTASPRRSSTGRRAPARRRWRASSANATGAAFEELSAVNAGKADVTAVIERARERLGQHGRRTILFLDEIHRFNKAQQDALLPVVESGLVTLIGATTENPYFEVNPALLSRCALYELEPPGDGRPAGDPGARRGRPRRDARPPTPPTELARGGDARSALAALELATATAHSRGVDAAGPRGRAGGHAQPRALRPRRRHALRRHLGVHQVDARLRPARRDLLAGGDAGRRRGPEVHRAAHGRLRLGGRRQRRPARDRGRHQRRDGGRLRRPARGRASAWRRPRPTWRWRRSRTPRYVAIDEALGEVRRNGSRIPPAHLRSSGFRGAEKLGPRRRLPLSARRGRRRRAASATCPRGSRTRATTSRRRSASRRACARCWRAWRGATRRSRRPRSRRSPGSRRS